MYLTVHASIGAAIGGSVSHPSLAFLLGIVSHFILDKIPHADPGGANHFEGRNIFPLTKSAKRFLAIVLIDTLLAAATTLFLIRAMPNASLSLLFGVIGSILPDYLFGLYFLTKWKLLKSFQMFHHRIHFPHKQYRVQVFPGTLIQILVFFAGILFLLRPPL